MMNKNQNYHYVKSVLLTGSLLACMGCSTREAAMTGHLVGSQLGKPIGVVAVMVDETFKTADDVYKANPRYDQQPATASTDSGNTCCPEQLDRMEIAHDGADNMHYYRTEVIMKTRGPADVVSMKVQNSQDVTAFWKE